jgi:hypothetical protein
VIFILIQWNLCNLTPEFSDILWHPTTICGPKVFLLTKIKSEYSDILYNPTHLPGPLVCQIRQVPLYMVLEKVNQDTASNICSVLIGWFWSTSRKCNNRAKNNQSEYCIQYCILIGWFWSTNRKCIHKSKNNQSEYYIQCIQYSDWMNLEYK